GELVAEPRAEIGPALVFEALHRLGHGAPVLVEAERAITHEHRRLAGAAEERALAGRVTGRASQGREELEDGIEDGGAHVRPIARRARSLRAPPSGSTARRAGW